MKKLQLVERDVHGRIHKNEGYFYDQMKKMIIDDNPKYWNHFLFGRRRKRAMNKIFDAFAKFTEKDRPGNFSPKMKV